MYADMNAENATQLSSDNQPDLSSLLVVLLKGVLYQDVDAKRWSHLFNLQNRVRDYVAVLGLELILDEAEGYAFLRSQQDKNADNEGTDKGDDIPRLVPRRQLSFPVSLLLALLRKKLAEFDASGGETRLVLTRDNIVDLIRLFLPDSSNEAKLVDQIDRHINKVVELGFLRVLKSTTPSSQPSYEVRRIIKAFVDAQWLAELDTKLEIYRQLLTHKDNNSE
ncbi:MAG: hypothetical protein ACI9SC_001838 [Gammaproteobacteria bacterium]|jgi:hypothetical protein